MLITPFTGILVLINASPTIKEGRLRTLRLLLILAALVTHDTVALAQSTDVCVYPSFARHAESFIQALANPELETVSATHAHIQKLLRARKRLECSDPKFECSEISDWRGRRLADLLLVPLEEGYAISLTPNQLYCSERLNLRGLLRKATGQDAGIQADGRPGWIWREGVLTFSSSLPINVEYWSKKALKSPLDRIETLDYPRFPSSQSNAVQQLLRNGCQIESATGPEEHKFSDCSAGFPEIPEARINVWLQSSDSRFTGIILDVWTLGETVPSSAGAAEAFAKLQIPNAAEMLGHLESKFAESRPPKNAWFWLPHRNFLLGMQIASGPGWVSKEFSVRRRVEWPMLR